MSDIPEVTPAATIPPTPPPPAIDPPATESGLTPNLAAALAEFFSVVGGLVFYFIEKNNGFVRFHALQSAYLGSAFILICIGISVLCAIPFLGFLFALLAVFLLPALGVAYTVALLIASFQAFNNKEWEIPWIGKLARKHLAEGKFFFAKSPAI